MRKPRIWLVFLLVSIKPTGTIWKKGPHPLRHGWKHVRTGLQRARVWPTAPSLVTWTEDWDSGGRSVLTRGCFCCVGVYSITQARMLPLRRCVGVEMGSQTEIAYEDSSFPLEPTREKKGALQNTHPKPGPLASGTKSKP